MSLKEKTRGEVVELFIDLLLNRAESEIKNPEGNSDLIKLTRVMVGTINLNEGDVPADEVISEVKSALQTREREDEAANLLISIIPEAIVSLKRKVEAQADLEVVVGDSLTKIFSVMNQVFETHPDLTPDETEEIRDSFIKNAENKAKNWS